MRTTITIDDDVLRAAKAIAHSERRSVGEIVSSLARRALHPPSPVRRTRNGIPLLPTRDHGTIITLEMVNALRDSEDL